ncbi:methyl-accepting chemotaxis protein [Oceanospirillum sanctuarii]|uniref:methyl-accepting chemotaxis protein n=1 Tax=Oceanospirillum sanctuarii TaxID=1434821 RepID=UPI000A3883C8|nr:methyl-accepting chemotaxis protein [Oceanospirillum sanctuarii]
MKGLSLRAKIIAMATLAVFVTSLALTGFSAFRLSDMTRDNVGQRVDGVSNAVGKGVERWLSAKYQLLNTLAERPADQDAFIEQLNMTREAGEFIAIFAGLTDGTRIGSNGRTFFVNGYDPRTRPWYKKAIEEKKMVLIGPYEDRTTKEMTFTIARPLVQNGQITGIIGADLQLKQLFAEITSFESGANSQLFLLNDQGLVIAHQNQEYQLQPVSKLYPNLKEELLSKLSGNASLTPVDTVNGTKLIRIVGVPNSSWQLGVEVDETTEMLPFTETLGIQFLISLAIFLMVMLTVALMVKVLLKDLQRVGYALGNIAKGEGDLTQRIQSRSTDEVGKLANDFNHFVKSLHSTIGKLEVTAVDLSSQSGIIADKTEQNSQKIYQQRNETNAVAEAVDQLAQSTQDIIQHVHNANSQVDQTLSLGQDGIIQVSKSQRSVNDLASKLDSASDVVTRLNNHAQGITGILNTIEEIAEQTNLLALNAAIEAARAGEAGRGFAVVADEVRSLSQRTSSSTSEIQQVMESVQQSATEATQLMQASSLLAEESVADAGQAKEMLTQILEAVEAISHLATHISSATEQQAALSEEIHSNTDTIRGVADDLARDADESEQQVKKLSQLAQDLKQEAGRFVI